MHRVLCPHTRAALLRAQIPGCFQWSMERDYRGHGWPLFRCRDAMYHLAEFGQNGTSWDTVMGSDLLHPNDLGHKIMADLVVYMLQRTVSQRGR